MILPAVKILNLRKNYADYQDTDVLEKWTVSKIALNFVNKKEAHGLLKDGRINFAVKADYSENEELDKIMKNIIDKIVIDTKLKNVTASQKDNNM